MYSKKQIIHKIKQRFQQGQALNITAVKREMPKLIQSAYAVKPFWGWRQAVDDAGIDYADICVELEEYVTCAICGRDFRMLSGHLRIHECTYEEYKGDFPDCDAVSEGLRAALMLDNGELKHWELIWSPEYVLDKIYRYKELGYEINVQSMSKRDNSITSAAAKHWGRWDNALRAIGLDPLNHRKLPYFQYHSKDLIIATIKERVRSGKPLDYVSVAQENASLTNAAYWYFGNWSNALRAAGLNPEKYLQIMPGRKYPDKRSVLKAIKTRRKNKQHLNSGAVYIEDQALIRSASRIFGDWQKALCAASLDPSTIYKRRQDKYYSEPESVIKEIKRRKRTKMPLNTTSLCKGSDQVKDGILYRAGVDYFGNWKNALKAAGIDPRTIYKRRPGKQYPNPQSVLKEIKRRKRTKMPLNTTSLCKGSDQDKDQMLWSGGVEYFGRWDKALSSAGLNPDRIYKYQLNNAYPDAESVLKEIKRRKRAKMPLNAAAVYKCGDKSSDYKILKAAKKFFDGWKNALSAAGLDPRKIYICHPHGKYPDADSVIKEIKRRKKAKMPLNMAALYKYTHNKKYRDSTLYTSGRKHFRSWDKALSAAGLDPDLESGKRYRYPDADSVLQEIKRRRKMNLPLNMAALYAGSERDGDATLAILGGKYFGGWDEALSAAGIDPHTVHKPPGSPRKYPDKSSVVQEIRKRRRSGLSLKLSSLRHGAKKSRDRRLIIRGREYFGSWPAALKAARAKTRKVNH